MNIFPRILQIHSYIQYVYSSSLAFTYCIFVALQTKIIIYSIFINIQFFHLQLNIISHSSCIYTYIHITWRFWCLIKNSKKLKLKKKWSSSLHHFWFYVILIKDEKTDKLNKKTSSKWIKERSFHVFDVPVQAQ